MFSHPKTVPLIENTNTGLESQCQELRKDNLQLRSELSESLDVFESLQKEYDELSYKYDGVAGENIKLQAQIVEQTKDSEKLSEKLKSERGSHSLITSKMQDDYKRLQARYERLSKAHDELQAKFESKEESLEPESEEESSSFWF